MNMLATIGHNQPPSPFEMSREEIEGLFLEAKNWLDGEGVNSAADADGVSRLLDMLRKAEKRADEARKEEKRPHDEAAKAVQERYKPLLERVKLASETCKKALTPWLERVDAEKRAVAETARVEAEQKAAEAQAAIRAARQSDLEEQEHAEALLREAKRAETAANRAENDKAHAKGGDRAVTLRTTYRPFLKDAREAAKHYWLTRRDDMEMFIFELAQKDVRAGHRSIPGFEVIEEREAV
jgi:hypothetical protein